MALTDRKILKLQFQPGRHLSAGDFETLIDSMLNKHTDQFHGAWESGRTYCQGDVVLYYPKENHDDQKSIQSCNFWVMKRKQCVCSSQEPPNDSDCWKPFPDDGDWVILADEGVMWAKGFERVGIGIGDENGDRPQARLDVRKLDSIEAGNALEGQGRWLLFPQNAAQTQTTFLHYNGPIQTAEKNPEGPVQPPSEPISYLITALSLEDVTWCSDASRGFTFRQGSPQLHEAEALHLDPTIGTVMMVVQPRDIAETHREGYEGSSGEARQLASLGLNVTTPAALLDITDPQRGHLFFLPDSTPDPTLCLLRPEIQENPAYTTIGVSVNETALVSNTAQGFGFYKGAPYAENPAPIGDVLLQLRQGSSLHRPQVGIGTPNPVARLDIHSSGDQAQVQLLPEQGDGQATPAIALLQHRENAEPIYLTTGLGDRVSGWVSNAERGFVFRHAIEPAACIDPELQTEAVEHEEPFASGQTPLQPGQTHLAIRESGFVGIGTEDPATRLEITSNAGIGKILFELDQQPNPALSVFNLEQEQSFTLGTEVTHAVLTTDTPGGFLFKAPNTATDPEARSHPLDITSGRALVNISPEGNGRVGVGRTPRDYEIDVQGIIQTTAVYQDTNAEQICNIKRLNPVLSKLRQLRPITFEWNKDAGFLEPEPDRLEPPNSNTTPSEAPALDPATAKTATAEGSASETLTPEAPAAEPASPEFSTSRDSSHKTINTDAQIGLLAHEVEQVFPEVVRTANDGSQSVAYANLTPILIQAINELNRQHHTDKLQLETLIEQLANRIAFLAIVLGISWAIAILGYLF